MTTELKGNRKQISTYHTYFPPCKNCSGKGCSGTDCNALTTKWGPCRTLDGISDWNHYTYNCGLCPGKPSCSEANPLECDIGLSSSGKDPFLRVRWNGQAPFTTCFFDTSKIDNKAQVDNYIKKFGASDEIMRIFCSSMQTTGCYTDPTTGAPMTKCSRVRQKGVAGDTCRAWFNNRTSAQKDTLMNNVCGSNLDAPECKCVMRGHDEIYRSIGSIKDINDGCWWVPCKDSTNFFVPDSVKKPTCPSAVCSAVLNVVQDRDVNINNVANYISCNLTPPTTFECTADGKCKESTCSLSDSTCFETQEACVDNCKQAHSGFKCQPDETCQSAACDPAVDSTCFSSKDLCESQCSNKTYSCIDQACTVQPCDPDTDVNCFAKHAQCMENCDSAKQHYQLSGSSCVPSPCETVGVNGCFDNAQCAVGNSVVPKPVFPSWAIALCVIGGIIALILIFVLPFVLGKKSLSGKQKIMQS
jgi:hypothetical protein